MKVEKSGDWTQFTRSKANFTREHWSNPVGCAELLLMTHKPIASHRNTGNTSCFRPGRGRRLARNSIRPTKMVVSTKTPRTPIQFSSYKYRTNVL